MLAGAALVGGVYCAGLGGGAMSKRHPYLSFGVGAAAAVLVVWGTVWQGDGEGAALGGALAGPWWAAAARVAAAVNLWNLAELTVMPGRRATSEQTGLIDNLWLRMLQSICLQDIRLGRRPRSWFTSRSLRTSLYVQGGACVMGLIASHYLLMFVPPLGDRLAHPFQRWGFGDVTRWLLCSGWGFAALHLIDVLQRILLLMHDDINLPAMSPEPYLSLTVGELWNNRWCYRAQLALKQYIYVPGRRLGVPVPIMIATTFAAAGLAHVGGMRLACPAAPAGGLGWVAGYFVLQGAVVAAEREVLGGLARARKTKPALLVMGADPLLMRAWVLGAVLLPAPLAIEGVLAAAGSLGALP